MAQIIAKINELKTPLKLNEFINGKTISIKRDNPDDVSHLGKEVYLKIYDRKEIAAGQSRYQIVQQPQFAKKCQILNDRRGDVMLLINGMPVIHIELKNSGTSVMQACNQIEKYSGEGLFTGLFSLIQVFVAMEPNETLYFANPGADGKFNKNYYFHWADFNNEPVNDWKIVVEKLLSIPMAHQLIGFYTVADDADGILKVMRSYQYIAAQKISDEVTKNDWQSGNNRGGYIWHTTGSGKTMTSFKSAQLIANSQTADKVIFLVDRIELGTQSLNEYRSFADSSDSVQATENTGVLIQKLKSKNPSDTLIVTSIQKMSRIKDKDEGANEHDILLIRKQRIVFIVDESHRSVFGDMMIDIKKTFPKALFFGFTGTPILEENQKKHSDSSSVFGDELHRYSIADGIRDKNVLGFDTYKVLTYKDNDLRKAVALEKAKASTEQEAISSPEKSKIYYNYMSLKMAGYYNESGEKIKGIEDYIGNAQYERDEHRQQVVNDIKDKWIRLSRNGKFHSILATSSILEAIEYYRLFKQEIPNLKVTSLLDPNIDNTGGNWKEKEDGLVEILTDYNKLYDLKFNLSTHGDFKKDVSARLAHKKPYESIANFPNQQLDLLIVVNQMLTGFDSKWVNTLYIDKKLENENIIQAFSRTNRLFGPDKPFGTICYYRRPHTMQRLIEEAVELYSGNKPLGLFVPNLKFNLEKLNILFAEIKDLFEKANILDFVKLPDDNSERGKFAKLFKELNEYLEAAKIQDFSWDKLTYEFRDEEDQKSSVELYFNKDTYLILALRYKELSSAGGNSPAGGIPFEIDGHLTEIDTGTIDSEYMNSRFTKYLKALDTGVQKDAALKDLHKSFASLTQEEQKYAELFLHDVETGNVELEQGKTFRNYITDYQCKAKNNQIFRISECFGLDELKLMTLMDLIINNSNINEYGRFDDLIKTVDRNKAKAYFEKKENATIPAFEVNEKSYELLKNFILQGGFEI